MKKFYLSILTILLAVAASAQEPQAQALAQIIKTGTRGNIYKIGSTLVGVYVPPRYKNVVFAKDINNSSVSYSEPTDAQIANDKIYDNVEDFDQSNWIKIYFPEGYDASAYEGKRITGSTVVGRVNVANTPAGPVGLFIDVDGYTYPTIGEASPYTGNTYNCANFVQQQWFFVKPKNLEYCNIQWAVYNGNNMFYVPKVSSWPGSFKVDMTLWEQQDDAGSVTADNVFTVGEAYEFPAIVEFSTDNQVSLNIDPGFDGDINYAPALKGVAVGDPGVIPQEYKKVMVYPLRIKSVVTAVEQVETASEVESVQYYDLQGRMSNAPLKGVNIKVTTYTDGTRETKKIVR